MTRKLPWQTGTSAPVSHPKRPVSTSTPAKPANKRVKIENPTYDAETYHQIASPMRAKDEAKVRTTSSSPPVGPPDESFMAEGRQYDDRYRMVEDEFLTIAKRFTVHIHAAEYKRQQKVVRERNAKAISSISRPVTGKMPDHTKRKVESVARSKTQGNTIQSLLSRAGDPRGVDSNDSDDGDPLPYVGTTLHGLMDSSRRKTVSLGRLRNGAVTTRAAAGFRKSSDTGSPHRPIYDTSTLKISVPGQQPSVGPKSIETSDDDDDLDAPISAPKLRTTVPAKISTTETSASSRPTASTLLQDLKQPVSSIPTTSASTLPMEYVSIPRSNSASSERRSASPDFGSRIAKRREKARMQRAKRQEEMEKKEKLNIIPTFI